MNSKLLIDAIVQQTTVLIAQLSTSAGIRAPLAHVADQVFVSLAREIEAQGVGRKVVADMFGIALRTYQKKVQRLTESATVRDRTLWEAVFDYLSEADGGVSRARILDRFQRDGERAVIAVLSDLVNSGLVYSSGRGAASVYRPTSDADRQHLSEAENREAVGGMVWARVYREPGSTEDALITSLGVGDDLVREAVDQLVASGRILRDDDGALRAGTLFVPVGAEAGWEAAVYDHFQAVANAIATKLRMGATRSQAADQVGGATLSFDLHPAHPYREEVLGILQRVRTDLNDLWTKVSDHNARHPIAETERSKVTFYFGQNVEEPPEPDAESDAEHANGADDGTDAKADGSETRGRRGVGRTAKGRSAREGARQ